MNIEKLISECHTRALNAGWWKDATEETLAVKVALFHSGLSEAADGIDGDLMDDKLPHRLMEEVEMADVVIRACDYAGKRGFSGFVIVRQTFWGLFFKFRRRSVICRMHQITTNCMEGLRKGAPFKEGQNLSLLISMVISYCESRGFDLEGAIKEKMEFNANRADHKLENRAQKGGEKF